MIGGLEISSSAGVLNQENLAKFLNRLDGVTASRYSPLIYDVIEKSTLGPVGGNLNASLINALFDKNEHVMIGLLFEKMKTAPSPILSEKDARTNPSPFLAALLRHNQNGSTSPAP